jgi:pSer/pThr/pTyr-binding forkhead associated (FHA) protein
MGFDGAGRSANVDVKLDPGLGSLNTISRRHAEVKIEGDTVSIIDCGSMNGVFVNCVKVRA